MARRRKSAVILQLSGSMRENKKKFAGRDLEPRCVDALGEPPAHLSDEEQACWLDIADCAPDNVLHKRDRLMVEEAAGLLALVRARGVANVKGIFLTRLEMCLGRLGLSPSDAPRVQVAAPPAVNEFDDIGRPRGR